ncbi:MAG: hypothetical protein M3R17_14525 [Bacteroidota bacterium]|nr:hypothetical protein [Bacteroidota bacterium]
MKNSLLLSAITIGIALGFNSCKTVYEPNTLNTPLFNNHGEFRAYVDPTNVQLAYAITDHIGVMANGYRVTAQTDNNTISGNGGLVEFGLGYFRPVNGFILETYAGGGFGHVKFSENRQENNTTVVRNYSADGMRFFIQPSFGYAGRFFEAAVTPRFCLGKYSNIQTNYTTQEQIDGKFYNINEPLWAFIEPAVTLRGGYKWIKLQAQFGISQKLNGQPLSYKSSFVNIGLTFDLNRSREE